MMCTLRTENCIQGPWMFMNVLWIKPAGFSHYMILVYWWYMPYFNNNRYIDGWVIVTDQCAEIDKKIGFSFEICPEKHPIRENWVIFLWKKGMVKGPSEPSQSPIYLGIEKVKTAKWDWIKNLFSLIPKAGSKIVQLDLLGVTVVFFSFISSILICFFLFIFIDTQSSCL